MSASILRYGLWRVGTPSVRWPTGTALAAGFIYQHKRKAGAALDDTFTPRASGAPEPVLGTLPDTAHWLRQVIVALTLVCRSSYRGVVEFVRDLLGRRSVKATCTT